MKNTHGGKRPNSGRKKKDPTVVKRVLVALVPAIDKLTEEYKLSKK
jgi:hypothetical protein